MHVVEYQRQTCEMNVENEKHAYVNLGQNQLNFYPVSYEKTGTKGRFLAQTHTQLSARKAPKKTHSFLRVSQQLCCGEDACFHPDDDVEHGGKPILHTHRHPPAFQRFEGVPTNKFACLYWPPQQIVP